MAVSQTLPWVPALLVAALSALALAAATFPARRSFVRQSRLAAIAILGISALATTVWQVWTDGEEIARLARHDRSTELQIRIKSLEQQLAKLEESTRGRSLAGDTAAKLTNYLRSFGSHKVVVSCIPNDIEAYNYATEIVDALRAANWDARGPETTTIFGKTSAMAVNVYDNAGSGLNTAKILLDGFAKFGIPYKTRVPPAEMLDPGAVELFIGTKPVVQPDVIVETLPGTSSPPERNISGN